MKYHVQVTTLAVVWRCETVEADSQEEATAIALAKCQRDDGEWEINGLYSDGTAQCLPKVVDVEQRHD